MAVKPTKVESLALSTHQVKNPTGLVLPDKTPVNVGMVIDGTLIVDPIWFRKHKDALLKAEGKVVLTVDLLVKTGGELPNKKVFLSVFAPHVPKLEIVEAPLSEDAEPNLKIVSEEESEDEES